MRKGRRGEVEEGGVAMAAMSGGLGSHTTVGVFIHSQFFFHFIIL